MKLFTENGYYEVVYDNQVFKYLEFIRLDTIGEYTYVTLKNMMTSEVFTFEEGKISKIRKKLFVMKNSVAGC